MSDQPYSSNQVIELTGITARQLQWWDERGLVVPRKEGHRRQYSLDDVAEIAVICDLRRRGFSVHQLHVLLQTLKEQFRTEIANWVRKQSKS